MPTQNELTMLQHLPLEVKVAKTQQRIREWVDFYGKDGVYVAFSGGKDSTVLLHLVREMYGNDIPAVFVDTGLEYPEIRQFVKTFDNVEILRPKMGFVDVITKYGYPIIGKEVAGRIEGVKKFINANGEKYVEYYYQINQEYPTKIVKQLYGDKLSKRYDFSKWKPLLDVDFNISPKCCSVMKKTPANIYAKITGRNSITGVMAEESRLRKTNWLKTGCNAFDSKVPMSNPMAFWKNQDVLQYIKENKIPICSVYGDIVSVDTDKNQYENSLVGSKLRTTGCQRTGCIFCAFGAHSRGDRRFLDLKITHPKQYAYCMNGGEFVDGIWKPNKQGLGMSHVFDEVNKIYGKDFIKYV